MPSSKQIIRLILSVILLGSPVAQAQTQSMPKGHKLPFCMVAQRSPAGSRSTLSCLRISNCPCILTQTSASVRS
jgi:hypothetical protein